LTSDIRISQQTLYRLYSKIRQDNPYKEISTDSVLNAMLPLFSISENYIRIHDPTSTDIIFKFKEKN
jgi:hypothetical protein